MWTASEVPHFEQSANLLRSCACQLMSLSFPERVVLAPGVLVFLTYLFFARATRSLLLVGGDYFGADHFRQLRTVRMVTPDLLLSTALEGDFDAVLASPVSHSGRVAPVGEWFRQIRERMGERSPMLIADASHIGAIGFRGLEGISADWVCGDLAKWVAPIGALKVGFGWAGSDAALDSVRSLFKPYFLALVDSGFLNQGSFVWPEMVSDLSAVYRRWLSDPENPGGWHLRNMALARSLFNDLDADCSIVCLPHGMEPPGLPSLLKVGLASLQSDGRIRVLCRADLWPSLSEAH